MPEHQTTGSPRRRKSSLVDGTRSAGNNLDMQAKEPVSIEIRRPVNVRSYYGSFKQMQSCGLSTTPSTEVRAQTESLAKAALDGMPSPRRKSVDTAAATLHADCERDPPNISQFFIQEASEPASLDDSLSELSKLLKNSPPRTFREPIYENSTSRLESPCSGVGGLHIQDSLHPLVATPSEICEVTPLMSRNTRTVDPSRYDGNNRMIDVENQAIKLNEDSIWQRFKSKTSWKKFSNRRRITKRDLWTKIVKEPIGFMPAVILGLLLNLLDALSYGMILFPLGIPVFSKLGPDGISMFYVSCIVAQLVFSCGGSIFKGGVGSEMIEVVPFFHQMALTILYEIGEDQPDAVIATTILAFAVSSVVTGIVFLSLGTLRLGSLIGFFPRHILVGCIGGIGWFLFVTGIEVSARLDGNLEYTLETLKHLTEPHTLLLWTIPLVLAFLLEILQRLFSHPLVVPSYFILIPSVFYIVVATVPSLNLQILRDSGWVFAAPEANKVWYSFYTLYDFKLVNWGALVHTFPEMLALTFFGILHVPINVPALGVSTHEDNVNVDAELRAHGVSNILSGFAGSVQNYLVYTNSILFIKSGGDSRVAGIMLAIGTAGIMFVGPVIIGMIPIMVVGALIFLLGMDLLKEALIDTIGKVHLFEYFTIVVIVITMGALDFVLGIVAGIMLACVSFVVQASRKSAIRARYSGAIAKSTVRRPPVQQRFLREAGHQIQLYKLSGFMFFGTIARVERAVRAHVNEQTFQEEPIRFLVMDLSLVHGLDFSAAEAFTRMQRLLATKAIHLVLCGVQFNSEIGKALRSVGLWDDGSQMSVRIYDSLNSALEACENGLLKTFYQHRDSLLCDTPTEGLDVPKTEETLAVHLDNSPRRHLLQKVATETLEQGDHSKQTNKFKNFRQPLPLLMQVFQDMSTKNEDFWSRVAPFFKREEMRAGTVLWKSGDESSAFYLLESGMIRATYDLENGYLIENIVPGTVAGELPFLSETERTAQLTVELDSILWKMDRTSFSKMHEAPGGSEIVNELLKIGLKLSSERVSTILSYGLTS